jgi:hypothetical protein
MGETAIRILPPAVILDGVAQWQCVRGKPDAVQFGVKQLLCRLEGDSETYRWSPTFDGSASCPPLTLGGWLYHGPREVEYI